MQSNFREQLLEHADIVELIKQRVALKKVGQNFVARCPFHDEKTASFNVNPQKQFYYCFGCGAHGNAIDFLITYDRMEFKEALAYLSQQTGIAPPANQLQSRQSKYQPLYALMEKINRFYQSGLSKTQNAKAYLHKRGLTPQIIEHFQLGYAPNDWQNLQKVLGRNASINKQLLECGMIIQKNNANHYDRFRHRIMFPIHNVRGNIIGFGGRSIDDETKPKYLNSPETSMFHKSYELYGLYQAKRQSNLKQLLVVEGYMDVIALHQYGLTETIATLGTAFNRHHLHKLLRYSSQIIFCFDGDEAGKNAAWKALTISLPLLNDGVQIRFLFLPNTEDPDSLIRKIGIDAFREKMLHAVALSDFFFTKLQAEHPVTDIASRAAFAKTTSDHLHSMPNGVMRQLMLEKLCKHLKIPATEIDRLINYKSQQNTKTDPQSSAKFTHKRLNPQQRAISLLLHQPPLAQTAKQLTFPQNNTDPDYQLLIQLITLFNDNPQLSIGQLLTKMSSPEAKSTLAELSAKELYIPTEGFATEFKHCIDQLNKHETQQEIHRLIALAKQNRLNPQEKQHLQELLKNNAKNN